MRTARIARKTNETDITLTICLDGRGVSAIQSGVGFLDHMLTLLARHGRLDLELTCRGDTQVDDHHSVEDIGIALGDAVAQALGEMAVPVFIAPGNHDFYGPQSPYARVNWPGNVHIFTTPDLESVELPDLNCVVHGCAFTAPRREDDPLAGFSASKDR